MEQTLLVEICKELDAICKQYDPRIFCRVSEPSKDYEEAIAFEDAAGFERTSHSKPGQVHVYVWFPSGISDQVRQPLRDRLMKLDRVSRFFETFYEEGEQDVPP